MSKCSCITCVSDNENVLVNSCVSILHSISRVNSLLNTGVTEAGSLGRSLYRVSPPALPFLPLSRPRSLHIAVNQRIHKLQTVILAPTVRVICIWQHSHGRGVNIWPWLKEEWGGKKKERSKRAVGEELCSHKTKLSKDSQRQTCSSQGSKNRIPLEKLFSWLLSRENL